MFIGQTLGETWIILGARIWRLHNLVGEIEEGIGALMGETLVDTLSLDLALHLEIVPLHDPLPPPVMRCIRHFGKCRTE
jgi:hypothetical protein